MPTLVMKKKQKVVRHRSRARSRWKVSVVIPVLNESRTIGKVVAFARKHPRVGEVLVVDDGSHDGTPELAQAHGARVITSSMLGKGASMEDGMRAARHEVVLYLDGDLHGLEEGLVDAMTGPLFAGTADFVKARFARSAGRVTVLTAKPLLLTYFPELANFAQPLGGIVAARREALEMLRFENDYGVDIGLLIDAAAAKLRLIEVDVGRLEHDSQSLEALGEMAVQVARTIVERAAEWGRLQVSFLRKSLENQRRRRAISIERVVKVASRADKLALVDMDGTLLAGRFVVELAEKTGRSEALARLLDAPALDPVERTRKIAAVFRGVSKRTFVELAKSIPLHAGAAEMVVGLRRLGYVVGVVTDSYHLVGSIVRRRVFADFCIANVMQFHGDRSTGKVTIAPATLHARGCDKHVTCKRNVVVNLAERMNLRKSGILAVGDNLNDICMMRAAGTSVAFQPKRPEVAEAADHVIHESLSEVLGLLDAD